MEFTQALYWTALLAQWGLRLCPPVVRAANQTVSARLESRSEKRDAAHATMRRYELCYLCYVATGRNWSETVGVKQSE